MATSYGAQMTKVTTGAVNSPGFVNGSLRVFSEQVTYATQTTGDTVYVARLPKGSVFLYGMLNTSVTLGTATLAIGITGATQKYLIARTLTVTGTPTAFGVNAAVGVAVTQDEDLYITIAETALPTSGKLDVDVYYSFN